MQSSETTIYNNVQNICILFKQQNNKRNHLPLQIFDDHYHFAHHKVSKRSLSPATHHQTRLDDDDRVHWAKQQRAKSRSKRDFIRMRPSRTSSRAMSMVDAMSFDDSKWPQMWYLVSNHETPLKCLKYLKCFPYYPNHIILNIFKVLRIDRSN